jgi:outer membrane protein assembly factor BamC
MKKTLHGVVLLAAAGLGACSLFPDHSNDYRTAPELPRVTLPAGMETRPFTDAYPVPAQTVKPVWKSKKFEVPAPAPLVLSGDIPADAAINHNEPQNVVTRVQDGNGYPALNVTGGFNQIWDALDQTLHAAAIKVDDRNQSLGLYYLDLADPTGKIQPYQLKVTRALNAYSLSLQKDDDTLAPQATASDLFDKIQAKWPRSSPDEDSKPRGKQ